MRNLLSHWRRGENSVEPLDGNLHQEEGEDHDWTAAWCLCPDVLQFDLDVV